VPEFGAGVCSATAFAERRDSDRETSAERMVIDMTTFATTATLG